MLGKKGKCIRSSQKRGHSEPLNRTAPMLRCTSKRQKPKRTQIPNLWSLANRRWGRRSTWSSSMTKQFSQSLTSVSTRWKTYKTLLPTTGPIDRRWTWLRKVCQTVHYCHKELSLLWEHLDACCAQDAAPSPSSGSRNSRTSKQKSEEWCRKWGTTSPTHVCLGKAKGSWHH